jgi:hypothetical protein
VLLDAGHELGHRGLVGGESPLREAIAAAGLERRSELGVVEAARRAGPAIAATTEEEPTAAPEAPATLTAVRSPAGRLGSVTPWALRQATSLVRAADVGPGAARADPLLELDELEDVLELEPQAASRSAVTSTVPASAANRDVRE